MPRPERDYPKIGFSRGVAVLIKAFVTAFFVSLLADCIAAFTTSDYGTEQLFVTVGAIIGFVVGLLVFLRQEERIVADARASGRSSRPTAQNPPPGETGPEQKPQPH